MQLKLEYSSENTVRVLSINNEEPRIHKYIQEIYKILIDLTIKKLKKLEGQSFFELRIFFLMIFSISLRVFVTGSVRPQRILPVNSMAGRWLRGFSRNWPSSLASFFAVASLACFVPRILALVFF